MATTVRSNGTAPCEMTPPSWPRGSARVDCVGLEVGQVGPLQGADVGGLQHDSRCLALAQRVAPPRRAEAPLVTGLEAGEAVLGSRGGEVVALLLGELQE